MYPPAGYPPAPYPPYAMPPPHHPIHYSNNNAPHHHMYSHALVGLLNQLASCLSAPHLYPPNYPIDIIYRLGAMGELDANLLRDLDMRVRSDVRAALALINSILVPVPSMPVPIHIPQPPPQQQHQQERQPPKVQIDFSKIDLSKLPILKKSEKPHQAIYGLLPKQCKLCGLRFADDEEGKRPVCRPFRRPFQAKHEDPGKGQKGVCEGLVPPC